jgi:predicted PurR-regulated permease PerM
MESLIESIWFQRIASSLERWFSIDLGSLIDVIQKFAEIILKKAAQVGASFLTQIPSLTLALVIVLASLFFVLMDGRRLVDFFRRNSFFNHSQTVAIQTHFVGLCRSVILASVLSGLAQALILLGFLLSLSIPKAFTWAMLVFLTSFIPLVGSAPISVGLMLFAFLRGQTTSGIVLAIAVVVVAASDNIIRPAVLKGGGDMHPLLGFLSALGGIQMMGFWGIFLGPVIVGTFLTTLDLVLSEKT